MNLIAEIRNSWGWAGIEPIEVVGDNDFGNLIVRDVNGRYWRICPEDVYCEVIAQDENQLNSLSKNQEFLTDWHMSALVEQAKQSAGSLQKGRKYCLAIPSVLGGKYEASNIKTAPLAEIISLSGDIAKQIQNLPDGAEIRLNVVD